MYDQLYKSIHEHVTLSEEEWELCKSGFIPKRMRKRQFLLQNGDVCRRLAFIEKELSVPIRSMRREIPM